MLRRQDGCFVVKIQESLLKNASFLVLFADGAYTVIPSSASFAGVGCIKHGA